MYTDTTAAMIAPIFPQILGIIGIKFLVYNACFIIKLCMLSLFIMVHVVITVLLLHYYTFAMVNSATSMTHITDAKLEYVSLKIVLQN